MFSCSHHIKHRGLRTLRTPYVLYGVSSERTFSPGDNPNAGRIKPHAKNVAIVTFANTPNATHATSVMFVRGQIIVAFAMSLALRYLDPVDQVYTPALNSVT